MAVGPSGRNTVGSKPAAAKPLACLLYTSDAADEGG